MIAEIGAGVGLLKTAFDVAKSLNSVENATALNEVKLSLQSLILEAQQSLFAAQEAQATSAKRIADLEAQIMRFKDWSGEAERYELVSVGNGAFAYMQKPGMRSSEPAHWLCASCFGSRKKSILQRHGKQGDRERPWTCPTCKASITTFYTSIPEYAEATQ